MSKSIVTTCSYNTNVLCKPESSKCAKCGWNPDVAAERRKATREKLRVVEAGKCKQES
jgi:anaerobic ribonucleoside-triphosphate reductase